MHQRRLDRISLEVDLMIARRRAEACCPGSPSWDAAMGLVEELEAALHQVEEIRDLPERLVLAPASN